MGKYAYLKEKKSPRLLVEAYKLIGIKEIPGSEDNPIILGWAEKLGLKKVYTNDEIAWCGLFVAICCYNAGLPFVKDPLWAKNWLNFGTKQKVAKLGDVIIFNRPGGGGHVAIYVGEDKLNYHILGGNQSNQTGVVEILKTRAIGIRRTDWKVSEPAEVEQIFLNSSGVISKNES